MCKHTTELEAASESKIERKKPMAIWKPSQPETPTSDHSPGPAQALPQASPVETAGRSTIVKNDLATIGKGLIVKGEISGTESLYIDGKVEGTINLPGSRVTIGRNGQVGANITAREIVVLGQVSGNVTAADRVDIHSEGSLSGDVAAARISIEDGAYFKGGIDIRKPEVKENKTTLLTAATPEPTKTVLP
jgi:cytoskeletal protein CcmA (bactofilin family)